MTYFAKIKCEIPLIVSPEQDVQLLRTMNEQLSHFFDRLSKSVS